MKYKVSSNYADIDYNFLHFTRNRKEIVEGQMIAGIVPEAAKCSLQSR